MTPGGEGSRTFPSHVDGTDIFVLQLDGRKRWAAWHSAIFLGTHRPMEHSPRFINTTLTTAGKNTRDLSIAGMYIHLTDICALLQMCSTSPRTGCIKRIQYPPLQLRQHTGRLSRRVRCI